MRLLQAMAGARYGGAEAFFERLVLGLAQSGQEQLVLIRGPARAGRLRKAGIAVREARFGGPLDLLTPLRFRWAVSAYRPDVVLTWMSRATRACPRGDFVHVARLGGYYDLRHYAACDHLVGNTRDLVGWMIAQGWPEDRVHYLPNFVAAERAAPVARAAFDTPADVPLALALGRLHSNKGFDTLLEAVARVPRLHLWLAGEGPVRGALEDQVRRLGIGGRVRLLGWRDDVASLLAAADFLVCPSRHEPLGNVVIEAWAAGVPVVAAASVGPATLVADGRTGLLVPVDDAVALGDAAERLAEDPQLRQSLAAAGHAEYEAAFTEEKVIGKYRDFFAAVTR
jgi:glycosyltransferase involved in cell wall biosynthesis